MHLRLHKAFLSSILAVALPLSMIPAPHAQASPNFPILSQEISKAATDPADCVNLPNNEPVTVPYAAVAAAEELIANGVIDDDIVSALNDTDPNVTVVGPQPRALPAVAALAVAGVAWCAKGALSSLVPSALQEMVHQANSNIPPPDWVMSAIFGCAGGPILGALTSQAVRVKFAGAVLATIIKLRNFG
ncbi:hypothetical protein UL82_10140 [Corynebacterium kutscheri]|uniref:Secreted protein n=1 Tax=Corynebacterium kutscheri TaxID=35755 RepID=A0A0F6R1Z6_9CORY|nr:hypothetical protein [Corynebacterium kutscheri]AKE42165.1 hypothetical protein UL82_10140 [Corynebacterium kutscheri]VEH10508.1 putative secreted protein [Corynebacterium kutscheri]